MTNLPLLESVTSISLLLLAYFAAFALYAKLRDRQRHRAEFTFSLLMQSPLIEPVWIDMRRATATFMKSHSEAGPSSNAASDRNNLNTAMGRFSQYEALAIGLRKGVLDEDILYEFLHVNVVDTFEQGQALVHEIRKVDDEPSVYSDFEALARRWRDRKST